MVRHRYRNVWMIRWVVLSYLIACILATLFCIWFLNWVIDSQLFTEYYADANGFLFPALVLTGSVKK